MASLGRTLVLLAHPGDETACAGLLQHLSEPTVAFVTNDAVELEESGGKACSPGGQAFIRQQQVMKSLALAGVHDVEFLSDYPYADKFCARQLCDSVPLLFAATHTLIHRHRPDCLLVPAYEGGHTDHDVCSFIGAIVRQWIRLPTWEMPLYHRLDSGELVSQRFREVNGSELMYPLSSLDQHTRSAMMSCYASEPRLATYISGEAEHFRPQERYDYLLPAEPTSRSVLTGAFQGSSREARRFVEEYAYNLGMPAGTLSRYSLRADRPGSE